MLFYKAFFFVKIIIIAIINLMKDFYTINFKEIIYSAEDTPIYLDLEIENAKKMGAVGFKILHGYGSHAVGGKICVILRKQLNVLKNSKKIKDFFIGSDWTLENSRCQNFLKNSNCAIYDEDLGKQNPGVTIVIL